MSTGELLDSAWALLATRSRSLLGVGFVLALVEQLALFPLRSLADVTYGVFPHEDRLSWYAVLLLVGFGTELAAVAVCGAIAAGTAPRALLGSAAPTLRRAPVGRIAVLVVLLVVLGTVAAVIPVGGLLVYLLFGLAVPVVVIEDAGPGRALLRSFRLSSQAALRAGWIRLLGWSAWFLIRLATGLGGWYALSLLIDTGVAWRDHLVQGLAWLLINTVAYPVLGCLDAMLLLETRMRTEGLDIALRRTLHRGTAPITVLAAPR
jgi:hypothetical protein